MTERFTPQQIVQILQTPLGKDYFIDDKVVIAERKKIQKKYNKLKETPRWFGPEEIKGTPAGKQCPDGANLIPGFTECSIEARAWWLKENVLDA